MFRRRRIRWRSDGSQPRRSFFLGACVWTLQIWHRKKNERNEKPTDRSQQINNRLFFGLFSFGLGWRTNRMRHKKKTKDGAPVAKTLAALPFLQCSFFRFHVNNRVATPTCSALVCGRPKKREKANGSCIFFYISVSFFRRSNSVSVFSFRSVSVDQDISISRFSLSPSVDIVRRQTPNQRAGYSTSSTAIVFSLSLSTVTRENNKKRHQKKEQHQTQVPALIRAGAREKKLGKTTQ